MVYLMFTLLNVITRFLPPPKLRLHPLKAVRCPVLQLALRDRELHTNALNAASVSFTVTNS